MTACPCCGNDLGEDVLDPKWLPLLPLSPIDRTLVRFLCEAYPEVLTSEDLAEKVYSGVSDGGPASARQQVVYHVRSLSDALKPFGWTVVNCSGSRRQIATYRLASL